jgi:hypothetical protein
LKIAAMKITKYFISPHLHQHLLSDAVSNVSKQKDDFLKEIINEIEDIEKEEIKFLATGNGTMVYAILEFVYYLKNLAK